MSMMIALHLSQAEWHHCKVKGWHMILDLVSLQTHISLHTQILRFLLHWKRGFYKIPIWWGWGEAGGNTVTLWEGSNFWHDCSYGVSRQTSQYQMPELRRWIKWPGRGLSFYSVCPLPTINLALFYTNYLLKSLFLLYGLLIVLPSILFCFVFYILIYKEERERAEEAQEHHSGTGNARNQTQSLLFESLVLYSLCLLLGYCTGFLNTMNGTVIQVMTLGLLYSLSQTNTLKMCLVDIT